MMLTHIGQRVAVDGGCSLLWLQPVARKSPCASPLSAHGFKHISTLKPLQTFLRYFVALASCWFCGAKWQQTASKHVVSSDWVASRELLLRGLRRIRLQVLQQHRHPVLLKLRGGISGCFPMHMNLLISVISTAQSEFANFPTVLEIACCRLRIALRGPLHASSSEAFMNPRNRHRTSNGMR